MKERLDILLVNRELVSSRTKAKSLIIAGKIIVNDRRIDKPGTLVPADSKIRLKEKAHSFVSRGGLKLEGALKDFNFNVEGATCLDIGASTGGFTQCLLKNRAALVHALDVGYNQLAWEIRKDERVVVHEKVNARYLERQYFNTLFDIITIDVIFISLKLIFPVLKPLMTSEGMIISLVKPQFEVGKGQVGKGGIVTDSEDHEKVLYSTIKNAEENGLFTIDVTSSPIKGSDGNREFFLLLSPQSVILDKGELKKKIEGIVYE